MSRKYKFHNPVGVYFVSFATVYWIAVFTRETYFQILANNLSYCRKEKGMELFAYCFMPNHIHLIFRDANENPSHLLRDFKKHTSKQLIAAIEKTTRKVEKNGFYGCSNVQGKKVLT